MLDHPQTILARQARTTENVFERSTPTCRNLVQSVEALLAQRRQRAGRITPAAHHKRWTREELCDLSYSSYKGMLYGKVRYLPPREDVECIADYLECTLDERNVLLKAACYSPAQYDLHGEALTRALQIGTQVVAASYFPACLVTRDWALHAANNPLLTRFGSAPQLMSTSPAQRTMLHVLFDPALAARAMLERSGYWEILACEYIGLFRSQHILCIHEPWYHSLIMHLFRLPDFAYCWNHWVCDEHTAAIHRPTRYSRLVTHFEHAVYPQVWTYVPQKR